MKEKQKKDKKKKKDTEEDADIPEHQEETEKEKRKREKKEKKERRREKRQAAEGVAADTDEVDNATEETVTEPAVTAAPPVDDISTEAKQEEVVPVENDSETHANTPAESDIVAEHVDETANDAQADTSDVQGDTNVEAETETQAAPETDVQPDENMETNEQPETEMNADPQEPTPEAQAENVIESEMETKVESKDETMDTCEMESEAEFLNGSAAQADMHSSQPSDKEPLYTNGDIEAPLDNAQEDATTKHTDGVYGQFKKLPHDEKQPDNVDIHEAETTQNIEQQPPAPAVNNKPVRTAAYNGNPPTPRVLNIRTLVDSQERLHTNLANLRHEFAAMDLEIMVLKKQLPPPVYMRPLRRRFKSRFLAVD